jgi:hypothetical protein
MSISSTTRKAGPYTGNAVTVTFPFAFKVFTSADLVVTQTSLLGVETTLTLTTDYTVSLNANQDTTPGGSITMLVAPASGILITLTSGVAQTQPVVLTNAGGFYPAVINDALDRVTILIQQMAEQLGRAAKVPISGIGSLTASTLVFGVDNSGNPILKALTSITSSVVSIFMSGFLAAADAVTARAYIGATSLSDVQSNAQSQGGTAWTTAGTPTAYTLTPTPAITSYSANQRFRVKFNAASGAAPTLQVSGVASPPLLKQYNGLGVKIPAVVYINQLADVEFDGTDWIISRDNYSSLYAALAGINTQQFNVQDATTANHAVAYDQVIGLGQTWQNVAGSRAFATTYTNSTGKPIMVNIALTMAASSVTTLTVGGIVVGRLNTNAPGTSASFSAAVPTGTTYILTNTVGANTISEWAELR